MRSALLAFAFAISVSSTTQAQHNVAVAPEAQSSRAVRLILIKPSSSPPAWLKLGKTAHSHCWRRRNV